jgi:hypothetical protein
MEYGGQVRCRVFDWGALDDLNVVTCDVVDMEVVHANRLVLRAMRLWCLE